MPNILTVRTFHGINTDIPFSSDRTVTTNMIHMTKMETFWNETKVTFHINKSSCLCIIIQHLLLNKLPNMKTKALKTIEFEDTTVMYTFLV